MKFAPKVFASLLTLLAASLVQAAETKVNRVLSIQDIITDDPAAYAAVVAESNAFAKAKLGIDPYVHVYVSTYDGEKTASVRAVIAGTSVAELTKDFAALQEDPSMAATREKLKAARKLGARVLYQGLRFDGTYKNGSVYTTTVNVSDEPAYLNALEGLRALFDAHGLSDAKINAYRVIAGRSNHTHRVTIAVASDERLSALLDFIGTDPDAAAWFASTAKLRTVVTSGTAHEITK